MASRDMTPRTCAICGKQFPGHSLVPGEMVRKEIAAEILKEHPDWSADKFICRSDLMEYRTKYVHSILDEEKGELTSLEDEVLRSLREQELLSTNTEAEFEEKWTFGERLADRIAAFGGSWSFIIIFFSVLVVWIIINSIILLMRPFDPYPYILLNLVLSCLAAMQAPVIMMSQNRQEAKDRLRAQHDYQVNLKAELEIRQLHEKVDHLMLQQWERLARIQEIQIDLLSELRQQK